MSKKFHHAIVREPCRNMVDGLSDAGLGLPDFELALKQHDNYLNALSECGLKLTVLEADEEFPDSCFVEDVALCTPHCAVITLPGAVSRRGEIEKMLEILKPFYEHIEKIVYPGTLEAGDVMMVGDYYYIGLSERTNKEGAEQLIGILRNYRMDGSIVSLKEVLHLKTGLAYLENNNLVVCGEFIEKVEFRNFNKLIIPDEESYAANCIWVNGKVIVPQGFPHAKRIIENAGYPTIEVDVSEYQKLDGGLSCLSLRF